MEHTWHIDDYGNILSEAYMIKLYDTIQAMTKEDIDYMVKKFGLTVKEPGYIQEYIKRGIFKAEDKKTQMIEHVKLDLYRHCLDSTHDRTVLLSHVIHSK